MNDVIDPRQSDILNDPARCFDNEPEPVKSYVGWMVTHARNIHHINMLGSGVIEVYSDPTGHDPDIFNLMHQYGMETQFVGGTKVEIIYNE